MFCEALFLTCSVHSLFVWEKLASPYKYIDFAHIVSSCTVVITSEKFNYEQNLHEQGSQFTTNYICSHIASKLLPLS